MISIDVIQRSAQMLLPDLDGCYWVISIHENTQQVHMIRKGQYGYQAGDGLSPAEQFYLLAV